MPIFELIAAILFGMGIGIMLVTFINRKPRN